MKGDERIVWWMVLMMAFIALLGVFAPEIGFDALWYHLTLPELWLQEGRWFYPGGLLYYSAMPRLGETLFIPVLYLFGSLGPKLLQYLAGIGSAYLTFRLALLYMESRRAVFAAGVFYISNVVAWQSGSAYIDLIRTFFEVFGVYLALSDKSSSYFSKRKLLSGVMLGLAVGTKWQALATLFMVGILVSPVIWVTGLITTLPWMIVAYYFTGNPMYPLLEGFMKEIQLSQVGSDYFSIKEMVRRVVFLPLEFVRPYDDYINPVLALVYYPAVYLGFGEKRMWRLWVLAVFGVVLWQLTPPPSTRYFLPYLPYLAVLVGYICTSKLIRWLLILSFVLVIGVRTNKSLKFAPAIFGFESRESYLSRQIDKMPGTFVDSDLWGRTNIGKDDRVYVEGVHNLYYIPGKYAHESWAGVIVDYDYLISDKVSRFANQLELVHKSDLGFYFYKVKK